MKPYVKIIYGLLYAAILIAGIYFFRAPIEQAAQLSIRTISDLVNPSKPCAKPILYSIGTFDTRFGIDKVEFKDAVELATEAWGNKVNKNLFQYSEGADFKINLIYDYRQESTKILSKLGIVIKNDSETYHSLKIQYDSYVSSYNTQKRTYETDISAYTSKKADYEKRVTYWNKNGGAPSAEYAKLSQLRDEITSLSAKIANEAKQLNTTISSMNAFVPIMNKMAQDLNLNVEKYNTVGSEAGDQYSEGEYLEDSSGKRVNIYQFDNNDKLIRVLTHELGHALGIGHLGDATALMYYLNDGTTDKFSAADISALKIVCRISE